MSLAELGRFAEAAKYEAEATRFAESGQHLFTINWAHFAASMLQLLKGDWGKAAARAEQWIAMLRTGNVAIQLPWAIACSAWAMAQIGEDSEALNRVREGEQLLDVQAARGVVAHRGWAYGAVGRAYLLLGQLDEARSLGDRAVESARRYPGFTAHALHLLGDIASHSDRFDAEAGAAHYREALALARRHGMRPLAAHCHLGLGKLYRQIGETEHARQNLAIASTMYRQMQIRFWLEQSEADMTNLSDMEPRVRPASRSSVSGGS
jgi:tetratricopeptide (TPR) repeat protein